MDTADEPQKSEPDGRAAHPDGASRSPADASQRDSPDHDPGLSALPATAILILEVDSLGGEVADGWMQGPLPVPLPRARFPKFLYADAADQATREQFLEARVHGLLYGNAKDPVRRHRWVDRRPLAGGWLVTAVESLSFPRGGPPGGLLVIHVELAGDPRGAATAVASLANVRPLAPGDAPEDLTRLGVMGLLEDLLPGATLQNHRIGYVVSHVTFPHGPPSGLLEGSDAEAALQWSRVLASANEPGALPGELRSADRQPCDIALSATWETCVLKNGAAFVGRTGTQEDPFHELAKALVHSTYLDALLLGIVQRDYVDELSNSISGLWEAGRRAGRLRFEWRMVRFRSEAWWSDISETTAVNRLLLAFQDAYDLQERQDRLHSDIGDVSRILAGERAERTNQLLNLIIVMSFGFGLAALVADPGFIALAWGLVLAALGAVGLALWDRRGGGG